MRGCARHHAVPRGLRQRSSAFLRAAQGPEPVRLDSGSELRARLPIGRRWTSAAVIRYLREPMVPVISPTPTPTPKLAAGSVPLPARVSAVGLRQQPQVVAGLVLARSLAAGLAGQPGLTAGAVSTGAVSSGGPEPFGYVESAGHRSRCSQTAVPAAVVRAPTDLAFGGPASADRAPAGQAAERVSAEEAVSCRTCLSPTLMRRAVG